MNRKIAYSFLAVLSLASTAASASNVLLYGQKPGVGNILDSPNGDFHLVLTQTGDLTVTQTSAGGATVWKADGSSGIVGKMDGDGCKKSGWVVKPAGGGMSVTDRADCLKWLAKVDSGVPAEAGPYTQITLQDDGNLVSYFTNVRWKSGAYGSAAAGATQSVIIPAGTVMQPGTIYSNGNYRLAFQTDGNFVVYNGNVPIFNAEINGKGGTKAQMQYDGNFVVYDSNNKALWNTGTAGNANAYMAFQPDGHLLIVKQDVVWARFGHQSTYWAPGKVGSPFYVSLGWLIPDAVKVWN